MMYFQNMEKLMDNIIIHHKTLDIKIVIGNHTVGAIYEDKKDEDGFLYIVYTSENTFG